MTEEAAGTKIWCTVLEVSVLSGCQMVPVNSVFELYRHFPWIFSKKPKHVPVDLKSQYKLLSIS